MAFYTKYNNREVTNAEGMITFTDVPNILTVEDEDYRGTKAVIKLRINGSFDNLDYTPYVSIFGETIVGVKEIENAVNKNFLMSDSQTTVAFSMSRAFKNCPTIAANFVIEYDGTTNIYLKAKSIGDISSKENYETNTGNFKIIKSETGGTSSTEFLGAKVDVDVYTETDTGGELYVTTLEKNMYDGVCSFNMSPVLTTIAETGKAKQYSFLVSAVKSDGSYSLVSNVKDKYNYIAQGYMVNQGNKFLQLDGSEMIMAQNFSRGTSNGNFMNKSLLYVYYPSIPFSLYTDTGGGTTINITYRDSALNVIGTDSVTWQRTYSDRKLNDIEINLSNAYYPNAFYVDLGIGGTEDGESIRYNVIKPLKATEHCQRILWRNSYGGISFFDFTGAKTESREITTSTYQKSIFDYYTTDVNSLDMVYDNDVDYSVTLKSHLIENDGKYIFNDLMQSPYVYTIINGQTYVIIIDSVTVNETDRNNIFEATVKYHYSMKPSII